MKINISFFFAISALAIPIERSSTENDRIENIKDVFFSFIFDSTYAEKQEFRNEISKIDPDEKVYLQKNLEFILNGSVHFYSDDYDY